MPNLFELTATTDKQRAQNQEELPLTATPDGALNVMDHYSGLALEGRVFQAMIGSAASPVSFPLAFNADRPLFVVDVPVASTIIPLRIQVYFQTIPGATGAEIVAVTGTNNVGPANTTPVTPTNTRTDNPVTSDCTLRALYGSSGVAPANTIEFWHTGYNFTDASAGPIKSFEWTSQQNGPPHVIVGPGTLAIYSNGGGHPTGYVRVSYIELPSSALT